MRLICIFLLVSLVGCTFAPIETTQIRPGSKATKQLDLVVSIGNFIDNRFPFWPRNETTAPIVNDEKQRVIKDFEPLPYTKEVRMPMGEVRSQMSHALRTFGGFTAIINPPGENDLAYTLKKAQETSDYLIVGEVNSFYIKLLGRNQRSLFTLPLDMTLFSIANIFILILSDSKSLVLSGGLFAIFTAECVLSLSVTVYSIETGNPLSTFHLEERSITPVDSITVFGDWSNEQDDWIDIGRILGEVALKNACNRVAGDVFKLIEVSEKKKNR